MHTFSCALQSVQAGDAALRFDADPADYSVCRLFVNDWVITFDRNGQAASVVQVEPEPAPDDTGASDPEPEPTQEPAP